MAVERPFLAITRDVIPADHPCLPGHFPGMPIVPGVVLLERVAEAWAASGAGGRVVGLVEAKFLRPVRPEEPFTIALARPTGGSAAFEIRNEGVLVRGRLRVEPSA